MSTTVELKKTGTGLSRLCPLFVDMDGTLVSTDLLWESAMLFASRHPLEVWRILLWLLGGKAHVKRQLAERAMPDPATLPYRKDILEFLREQKSKGRELILATAADERIASCIASHLQLFDAVIASDGTTNLSGHEKLKAILLRSESGQFGYIGNSSADVPLWAKAADSYLVSSGKNLIRRAGQVCQPNRIFPDETASWKALLKALRPNQWIKNLLILVPLFAAHKIGNAKLCMQALIALATFSMCASAVYIGNDLLDLDADRQHPRKRLRPFAAGLLPIPFGIATAVALIVMAFSVSVAFLPSEFTLYLATYFVLTTAYSAYFKRRLLQDVFLLAGLYTLRILAGGAAVGVEISPWLLGFSLFFFLSLAFVKRYSELLIVVSREQTQASGRGYIIQDMEVLASVGPTSGYLAVLVMCLYINSDAVRPMYKHPGFLWLVCPILLFWITRIWFLARRQTLADDPVVFAVQDRVSIVAGIIMAVVFLLSV